MIARESFYAFIGVGLAPYFSDLSESDFDNLTRRIGITEKRIGLTLFQRLIFKSVRELVWR
ncbi:MAG: hypothetical protein GY816_20205 [Cytophagales bacterium]|nr:hypothetical protein [Cytophagales bacterium]